MKIVTFFHLSFCGSPSPADPPSEHSFLGGGVGHVLGKGLGLAPSYLPTYPLTCCPPPSVWVPSPLGKAAGRPRPTGRTTGPRTSAGPPDRVGPASTSTAIPRRAVCPHAPADFPRPVSCCRLGAQCPSPDQQPSTTSIPWDPSHRSLSRFGGWFGNQLSALIVNHSPCIHSWREVPFQRIANTPL